MYINNKQHSNNVNIDHNKNARAAKYTAPIIISIAIIGAFRLQCDHVPILLSCHFLSYKLPLSICK